MTIISGFIYVTYFILLGAGLRIAFNLINKKTLAFDSRVEFMAHAFFQGVLSHILIFNIFQFFDWPNSWLLSLLIMIVITAFCLLIWQFRKGFTVQTKHVNSIQFWTVVILIIIASLFIYWNGNILPNIAWDSWSVWEGKANQWIEHGLSTDIVIWDDWIANDHVLFSQAANYPDGLSLIYYLPKLIMPEISFSLTQVVYLFAFAMMTMLLVSRIAKHGASIYLQAFMVLVIYTTPLISNHLMVQGYADIWLAMYVLLIMLTLMDFNETKNRGMGLTLLCYLAMLPMLKLEGWVWLLLFALAYFLVKIYHNKYKYWFFGAVLIGFLILASGIINFSFPKGDLVINHQRLAVFNLIDTPIHFVNITNELLASFFWQNNWSVLWLGLPFVIISFFIQKRQQASQVAQVFFITALLCFLFLFYFTEASHWAIDFTAINRLVLQLTPCYLYLLFKMLIQIEMYKPKSKKAQVNERPPNDENTTT